MFFAIRPLPLINLKMAQSKSGALDKGGMDFRIVCSGPAGSTEFHKTCVNFYSFFRIKERLSCTRPRFC